jgi:hypothetical protein
MGYSSVTIFLFSNLTAWKMKSGRKRRKKDEEAGKGSWESSIMILQHAVFEKKTLA